MVSALGPGCGDRAQGGFSGAADELIGVIFDADAGRAELRLHLKPAQGAISLTGLPPRARFAIHGRKHTVDVELRLLCEDDLNDGEGKKRRRLGAAG